MNNIHSTIPIIFFLLNAWVVTGQQFLGEKIVIRDAQLTKKFSSVEVYSLPVKEMAAYAKRRHSGSNFGITLGGDKYDWILSDNNQLRPESKITTLVNGKIVPVSFDQACRTFIGYDAKQNMPARLTITERTFMALIPKENETYYIQPLKDFIKGSDPDLFVYYRDTDVLHPVAGSCGVVTKTIAPTSLHENEESIWQSAKHRDRRSYNCLEIEVTLATDNRMYNDFNAEPEELIDFVVTVQAHVEHHYLSTFDIDFWIQEYFIVTSISTNPWGQALEVTELQVDFSDWAYDHFDTEDIGHVWTGGNVHDDGDFNAIGWASVGGACDDIGVYPWAVLERDAITDISNLALLQAHEYGHLLDADHEPGSGTIMEPNLSAIECSCWDPDNIEEMWSFIEDEGCIETCVQCPVSYTIIDKIAWGNWRYSTQAFIISNGSFFNEADVLMQSEGYVKLVPGFYASSLNDPAEGATFVGRIAPCE